MSAIRTERPYIALTSERRPYAELEAAEKAVVRLALSRESVTRDEVVDELAEDHTKASLRDAFTALGDEQRFLRVGNRAEHVMVERDLF